ncbi:hypothetical protein CBM2623_A270020 [Cupriavidus taiwanensis]|nr:hypothetical protein CBM2617_A260029 [Cupriavidus taiwanensis]SPA28225.1 hypothetical protein CBM2623_A270020 [Cupriavidus taiwanensis]SPD44390.1 protein of unknown function [Cupriavidus taiwanensis]
MPPRLSPEPSSIHRERHSCRFPPLVARQVAPQQYAGPGAGHFRGRARTAADGAGGRAGSVRDQAQRRRARRGAGQCQVGAEAAQPDRPGAGQPRRRRRP